MRVSDLLVMEEILNDTLGGKEITGRNEAKRALKTNETKDIDGVGADRADEHDEVEDRHEQDKVSYRIEVVRRYPRYCMGSRAWYQD